MTDCVIVQPIARCGVDLLRHAGLTVFEAPSPDLKTLLPHLKTARAAITRNHGLSADAIASAPNLTIIASHGTGTDSIDKNVAAERGISIASTPGTNALSVAEHALALIFACARHIPAADLALRGGDWAVRERLRPVEVTGRRLGLVGYGHVAQKLAKLARGIGLHVLVHSTHSSDDVLRNDGVHRAATLEDLLTTSQVVSLHGLPGDTPVLNAARLALLRPDAILINTARGALIDEVALAHALRRGRLSAAGLDVFATEPLAADSPLRDCPNLILTPHMGGSAAEALDRTALEVARKVIEGLGLPMPD
jgi:D-3-phosphoglycerate dehydrogenase